jgi:hypothetical protein
MTAPSKAVRVLNTGMVVSTATEEGVCPHSSVLSCVLHAEGSRCTNPRSSSPESLPNVDKFHSSNSLKRRVQPLNTAGGGVGDEEV